MLGFVINLDSAPGRWEHMVAAFQATDIRLNRIAAVDGAAITLPMDEFDVAGYRRRHGREINIFEVACYLSHLKAMRAFLEHSDAEHALILEDDVSPSPSMDEVIREAMKFADRWSVLRLSGLSRGKPLRVRKLPSGHTLSVNVGRVKGAGAYIVNRAAAKQFVDHLLPITLPYDHALDREWFWGLNAVCALPFPISQTDRLFRTSIQQHSKPKLSRARRYATTYPYQAFNELSRYIFRLCSLTLWEGEITPPPSSSPPGTLPPPTPSPPNSLSRRRLPPTRRFTTRRAFKTPCKTPPAG